MAATHGHWRRTIRLRAPPFQLRTRCLPAYALFYVIISTAACEVVTSPRWVSAPAPEPPPQSPARLHELLEVIRDGGIYPVLRREEQASPRTDPAPPRSTQGTRFHRYTAMVNDDDIKRTITVQSKAEDNVAGDREKRHVDENVNRTSKDHETSSSTTSPRRVKTGDTILNIRGAVRDSIGDAGAAPPAALQTSRIDTFVIRPAQHQQPAPIEHPPHSERAPPERSPTRSALPELVVAPHSRARLPCDLHNVTDLRWYKDGEPVMLSSTTGAAGVTRDEGGAAVVGRAGRGDAGTWRCTGTDRAGKTVSGTPLLLTLHESVRSVYLAVDGRRLDAGNTWVPVREKTVLEVTCVAEGGVPRPELSWRLVAADAALDARLYLRHDNTNRSAEGVSWSRAVVTAARELHNASLRCVAAQAPLSSAESPPPAPLAKLELHVTYPPSFVISRWPGFGVALRAGAAAALRCDVDANPPVRAWWHRDGSQPTSSPPPLEGGAGGAESAGAATLRWGALAHTHAGWYRCRATWADTDYSSIGYYLNVISAEEGTEASAGGEARGEHVEQQKVDVALGGAVQLHCPKGSVGCWWRRVVGNSSAPWAPAGSHHAHGVLGIKDAIYQEGGEYRCLGARAPDLARLKELKRVTVRVTGGPQATALSAAAVAGGGWRLECGACGRRLRARWLLPERRWLPAALAPDLQQHCWRAALHVTTAEEVWCVVTEEEAPGPGSVAVFPPRSPTPSHHSPRALAAGAGSRPRSPPHSRAHVLLALVVLLALP